MDGMSFEEAWRGEDGLSLRYKERLILALEDILYCVEINGGIISTGDMQLVAGWWSNGSERDLAFMNRDITNFVDAHAAPAQNGD